MILNLGLEATILLEIYFLLLSIPIRTKKNPKALKNDTLTLFWSSLSVICLFSFDKRQSEGQRNVVRVHMNNGRYPTVVVAQDTEELLSLWAKNAERVDEKLCVVVESFGWHGTLMERIIDDAHWPQY